MLADKTLLLDFIMEKLSVYQDPKRRGVSKGQKIGFSRAKYAVALFDLYDYTRPESQELVGTLDQLARKLKTTPHMIWQWRTEPEFRDQVLSFASEFSERFLKFMEAAYETFLRDLDRHATQMLSGKISPADATPSICPYLERKIGEAIAYRSVLQAVISAHIRLQARAALKQHDVGKCQFLLLIRDFFLTPDERAKERAEIDQERKSKDAFFTIISATLSKSRPTRSDRKAALLALAYLREELERHARASGNVGSRRARSRGFRDRRSRLRGTN
jgi:hypothetical protein